MKVAILADTHVCGRNIAAFTAQSSAMTAECVKRGVAVVLHAGDLVEYSTVGDRDASTGAVAEAILRWVTELANHAITMIAVPGNHDSAGVGSKDAMNLLHGALGVKVIREPSRAFNILCLPWSWSGVDSAEEQIETLIGQDPVDILLGHVEVVGGVMNNGRVCEPKPGKFQISRGYLQSLVDRELVGHIALGHFHRRQDLTGRGGYVGALMQHSFGEERNSAGFEVYDTDTGKVEWIDLDAAPKHQTYMGGEGIKIDQLAGRKDNRITRVRFADKDLAPPDLVRDLERAGFRVEFVVEPFERTARVDVPDGVIDDPRALVRLWAGAQTLPLEEPRVDRMVRVLDELTADKNQEVAL